jgi:hypothetical protein
MTAFQPSREAFQLGAKKLESIFEDLKGQRKARISRFPAGTKEFLAGTRE